MAIANRAKSANPLAWACLQSLQNLWDFALSRKKKKQNPKVLLIAWRKGNRLPAALLTIA